jgi:hypothetical protein
MSSYSRKIRELVEQRPISIEEVLGAILAAALVQDEDAISEVLAVSKMSGIYDEMLAIPAVCALPAWRERGLDELLQLVRKGHYADIALRVLLHLALGLLPPTDTKEGWSSALGYDPNNLADGAWTRLRELSLSQTTDRKSRNRLTQVATIAFNHHEEVEAQDLFWRILTDSPLSLNEQIVSEFKLLLAAESSEEKLQAFLAEHPVFLDATAVEIVAKHKLGSEYVTDFVIRQVSGDYVLVEIEKSTDGLFTSKGRVHHELSDALAQVREFQRWVHDNIAYARTLLPGVSRPRGIVVIGRSADLTPQLRQVLDEENFSRRGYIEILTYDDLLERAQAIYQNLITPRRARGMRGG